VKSIVVYLKKLINKLENSMGFTLVELLAVILLLGLIIGISSPTIINIINNAKNSSLEVAESSIKKSANLYTKENKETIKWVELEESSSQEYTCVSLEKLINEGLLKRDSIEYYVKNNYDNIDDNNLDNIFIKVTRDSETKSIKEEEILKDLGSCSVNIDLNINAITSINSIDVSKTTCTINGEKSNNIQYKIKEEDNWQDQTLFTNLTPLTKYTVYAKCTDSSTNEYLIKKKSVVTANYGKLVINYDEETCSTSKEITITGADSSYSSGIEYSIDGKKSWKDYTGEFSVDKNVIIYARYKNNNDTVVSKTITTIDKSTPSIKLTNTETTVDSASINYEVSNKGTCGKTTYTCEYGTTTSYGSTVTSSDSSCNIPNLNSGTKYYYKITSTNANGNSDSITGNFNTKGKVYISLNTNGGTVTTSTNYLYKTDTNGKISVSYNSGTSYTDIFHTINYNESLGTSGLANYNDSSYLNITKTGYHAISGKEWICESGCSTANKTFNQDTNYKASDFCSDTTLETSNCNITLKANWEPNTYTIEYYQGNNSTTAGATKLTSSTCTYGSSCTLTAYSGTVPSGWTFAGWGTSTSTTSVTYSDKAGVSNLTSTSGGTVKLYAIFKRTITFKSGVNEAISSTATQYYNPYVTTQVTSVAAPAPSTTTLSSYSWSALGYRTDTTATTATYSVTTSAKSITPAYNASATLYAVYSRTITFYSGVSKATSSTATQYYNSNNSVSSVTAPAPSTTTLSSYSWSALGYRADTTASGASYSVTTSAKSISPAYNVSAILYAVYSRTITFKSGVNEATSSTITQYYNSNGSVSSVTAPAPSTTTLSGYGWTALGYRANTTASGASYSVTTSSVSISPDYNVSATLYAVYSRTVTFKSGVNGATSTTTTQYYNSYHKVSLVSAPVPASITNWTVLGYRADTTATSATYSVTTSAINISPAYNLSTTLYAVYSRTLTISYNGNSSTSGSTTSTTKTVYLNANSTTTSSQSVTLASNGFSRTYYTFYKWAAGSTSGTQYSAGSSYNPSIAYNASSFGTTMYAIWNINFSDQTFYVGYSTSKQTQTITKATGGTESFTYSGSTSGITVNSSTGTITISAGKSVGTYSFNITATDSKGLSKTITITLYVCPLQLSSVASESENKSIYATDFLDAVSRVSSSGTITVLTSYTDSKYSSDTTIQGGTGIPITKSLKINTNGKTVTLSETAFSVTTAGKSIYIYGSGTITNETKNRGIISLVANSNVYIGYNGSSTSNPTLAGQAPALNATNGKMYIYGGTITSSSSSSSSYNAVTSTSSGEVYIYGGTIKDGVVYIGSGGKVEMSSGTISNSVGSGFYIVGGSLTVKGGSIKGKNYGIMVPSYDSTTSSGSGSININISGGTINATNTSNTDVAALFVGDRSDYSVAVKISGGTFSSYGYGIQINNNKSNTDSDATNIRIGGSSSNFPVIEGNNNAALMIHNGTVYLGSRTTGTDLSKYVSLARPSGNVIYNKGTLQYNLGSYLYSGQASTSTATSKPIYNSGTLTLNGGILYHNQTDGSSVGNTGTVTKTGTWGAGTSSTITYTPSTTAYGMSKFSTTVSSIRKS
jgi:type II secretory pathway pseudopilin PulG